MIKLLWGAGSLETLSPHTQQPCNGLAYTINDLTKYNPQKHLTPCMIQAQECFFFSRNWKFLPRKPNKIFQDSFLFSATVQQLRAPHSTSGRCPVYEAPTWSRSQGLKVEHLNMEAFLSGVFEPNNNNNNNNNNNFINVSKTVVAEGKSPLY